MADCSIRGVRSVELVATNFEEADRFYQEVPYAKHQLAEGKLDLDYYKRHNIETVLRIRLKRIVDAYAIRYFTKHDPVQAKAWAHSVEVALQRARRLR